MDAAITELGAVQDHRLVDTAEDRYRIIETIRAGFVPISSEIEALRGYAGGDPKPAFKKYMKLVRANRTKGTATLSTAI